MPRLEPGRGQAEWGDFAEAEPRVLGTSGMQAPKSHNTEASARATGEDTFCRGELRPFTWAPTWPVHPLPKGPALSLPRGCGEGVGAGGLHPRPCSRAEWPALLQKQVSEGQYGPGMAELEQQIAEHNILQKEIEAYGQQLRTLIGPVGELCPHPSQPQPRPSPPIRARAG